jgi:hypothetical protein
MQPARVACCLALSSDELGDERRLSRLTKLEYPGRLDGILTATTPQRGRIWRLEKNDYKKKE